MSSPTASKKRRSAHPGSALPLKPHSIERHLHEYAAAATSSSLRVDREQGIIFGVKVVGRSSPNSHGVPGVESTEYTAGALESSCRLYEGVKVNINHPDRDKPGSDRKAEDRIGKLINCRMQEGELYADLQLLKTHPMAERLFEAADKMPDAFGLSHNALGKGEVRGNKYVILEIPEVRSVDVVADAGTVQSLFESQHMTTQLYEASISNLTQGSRVRNGNTGQKGTVDQVSSDGSFLISWDDGRIQRMSRETALAVLQLKESKTMKPPLKLRTLFEAAARAKIARKQPHKAARIRALVEALDNMPGEEKKDDSQKLMEQPAEDMPAETPDAEPVPAPADETAVAADPDAALANGFRTAAVAVLDDASMALPEKLKRLKELLTTQEKLMAAPEADIPAADAALPEGEVPVKEGDEAAAEDKDKEKKVEESRKQHKALSDRIAILESDKARLEADKARLETAAAVRRELEYANITVAADVFEALCEATPKHRKALIEQQRQGAQPHYGRPQSRGPQEVLESAKRRAEEVKDSEAFAKRLLSHARN